MKLGNISFPSKKAVVKIVKGVGKVREMDENGEGIDTLRKVGTIEHYGNPFCSLPKYKTSAKVKTENMTESVRCYKEWLEETNYQNIEPERRKWILEQINSGKLDGKILLYYKKFNEPCHADILADIINNRKK